MKIVALICRILLGLMFVVFGLNGFLHFIPMGPTPPPDTLVGHFFASFAGSGWIKVIAALQVIGGLLVLIGGTLPLGLVILCPITFNILCFHILLTGWSGIGAGLTVTVLELVLIYAYRANFAGILTTKATPTLR